MRVPSGLFPWISWYAAAVVMPALTWLISSFQAAAANADWANADEYYVVLTDQPGDGSWPIVGATFILIYKDQQDVATAMSMLEFFNWCYGHGDDMAVDKDYVPIPDSVVEMVQATWKNEILAGGKPVWE